MIDDPTLPARDSGAAPAGHYGRFQIIGALGAGGMGMVLAAYDPDLDREIAIKVLHPDTAVEAGGPSATERLGREARAMARLAHPNVVTVYEVGAIAGRTFVAMELVEGKTLRQWISEPRTWRAVVAMFVAAGRGLAAAHDAGLVHRDFKPDNVLIGADGRPRVTDFGLVSDEPDVDADADPSSTDTRLAGTPPYMAPERWHRRDVGPRSDQFAFCVALWEALHGARPFAGDDLPALRRAITTGAITEPRGRRRVPRWLDAAIRRGLAVDEAARWPELTALLDRLQRGARRRRWGISVGAAATGASIAAAAVLTWSSPSTIEPCAAPTARLAAVWSPARDVALRGRLARLDPSHGAARGALTGRAFAQYATSWRAMHVEACRANRVEARQSDTVLDRRMTCLDRSLLELDQTVAAVEASTTIAALDRAIPAVVELPALADCADPTALADAPDAPRDPASQRELAAIDRELAEVTVARRAGRSDPARAAAVVERARRFGYPPRLARALDAVIGLHFDGSDGPAARDALRELTTVAATAREDWIAARAWIRLLNVHADLLGQPAEAEQLVPAAAAAVARAGDRVELRYDLLEARATIAQLRGDPARAHALLDEAIALVDRADAPALTERRSAAELTRGLLLTSERRWADAIPVFRNALVLRAAVFGEDSGDLARVHYQLGEALRHVGKIDETLAAWQTAARLAEARLAPSPLRAIMIARVGSILTQLDRHAEALPYLERGVAMAREVMPADSGTLAALTADLGTALRGVERNLEAKQIFEAHVAREAREPAPTVNLAIGLFNLGDVEAALGDCATAAEHLARSLTTFEATLGATHATLAYPLVRLARCHVDASRWRAALAATTRVLALPVEGLDPEQRLHARYLHARARYELRLDRAAALADVRAVRDDLARSPDADRLDLEAWLAAHR